MNTYRVHSGPGNKLKLTIDDDRFFAINNGALELEGQTLLDWGSTEPTKVYEFIRHAVTCAALEQAIDVLEDGKIVAAKAVDGDENTGQLAESLMSNYLPPSYERSLDVSIAVSTGLEDQAHGMESSITLLRLLVTPPSLA